MACPQSLDRRAHHTMPPSVLAKRAGRSASDPFTQKNSSKASIQYHHSNYSNESLVEPKGRRARLNCYPKRTKVESKPQYTPVDFESLPPAVRRKVCAPRLPGPQAKPICGARSDIVFFSNPRLCRCSLRTSDFAWPWANTSSTTGT